MKLLRGTEHTLAARIAREVLATISDTHCSKMKRGVVLMKGSSIIGAGRSGPPPGFPCDSEFYINMCMWTTTPPEYHAIADARRSGIDARGSRAYVAMMFDDRAIPVDPVWYAPYAVQLRDHGVGEVVLPVLLGTRIEYGLHSDGDFPTSPISPGFLETSLREATRQRINAWGLMGSDAGLAPAHSYFIGRYV